MVTASMQPVGKALIVYGTVKAIAPDGSERLLAPNSMVYADERIVTGSDGRVSLVFNDGHEHLDLGRMMDITLDEDVYYHDTQDHDAVAEVADIQQALLEGDMDPTTDLPEPAAGNTSTAARGGGRHIVVFAADHMEVLPDSGAETTGEGLDFLDPPGGIIYPGEGDIEGTDTNDDGGTTDLVSPDDTWDSGDDLTSDSSSTPTPITVDDEPSLFINPIAVAVQEDALANALSTGLPDSSADQYTVGMDLASLVQSEGGALNFSLLNPNGANSGLTSNGTEIVYSLDGNTIEAYAGETLIFTFEVNPVTGEAIFTLNDQLDHSSGAGDDANLAITNLGQYVQVTVTDESGDAVTLDFTDMIIVEVENDIPELELTTTGQSIVVQEDALGSETLGDTTDNDASTGIPDDLVNDTDVGTIQLSDFVATVASGADEEATVSYSVVQTDGADSGLTSNGTDIVYVSNGNVLEAYAGETLVFTLTIDEESGEALFNLNDQIDHPAGADDDSVLDITNLGSYVQVTVTDADGDSVSSNFADLLTVSVENDVPEVSLNTEALAIAVQEDALGSTELGNTTDNDASTGIMDSEQDTDTGTIQLADLVDAQPGADEPLSSAFTVTELNGIDSGLTSNGETVTYTTNGNTIEAYAGNTLVFTFTVNEETGEATFDLNDQLDHPEGSGDDATLAITNLGDYVELTVTDADGNTALSSTLENLITVTVENDVPEINLESEPLTIAVQEDALGSETLGNTTDSDASTGIMDSEQDTDVGSVNLADLLSSSSGADEPLTTSFSVTDISGVNSGLTSNGVTVTYTTNGNTIEAYAGETLVFTFTVAEDGTATFDLNDQLDHPEGSGDDATLSIDNLGDYIEAVVTDADGDTVAFSDLSGLLSVSVENDVPEITMESEPLTIAVQEDALGSDTLGNTTDSDASTGIMDSEQDTDIGSVNLADLISSQSGADEPLTTSFSVMDISGVDSGLTSNGVTVTYTSNGNAIEAYAGDTLVFTFTVDEETGQATFDLNDQLDHPAGSGDDAILTIDTLGDYIEAVITDADGDTAASSSLSGLLSVTVENDVPEISLESEPLTIAVQEDALGSDTLGNTTDSDASTGIMDSEQDTDIGSVNLADLISSQSGADEPLTTSFSVTDISGVDSGLTSNGVTVTYTTNGNTIEAYAGETLVFTFTVAEDGTATFDLNDQLDHPEGSGDDATLTIDTLGDYVEAVVTDADGDTAASSSLSGLLSITVENDVPEINLDSAPLTIAVQEDALGSDTLGNTADNDASTGIMDTEQDTDTGTVNLSDLLSSSSGADEPLSTSFSVTAISDVDSGLTSDGVTVTYTSNGNTIEAWAGDTLVFTFTVEEDGTATFDLNDQLDHLNNSGDDATLTIDNLGDYIEAVVTDADGDTAAASDLSGLISVTVENDVPELLVEVKDVSDTVYEDGLENTTGDGPNGAGEGVTEVSLDLTNLCDQGADEVVTYSLSEVSEDFASGLTADGEEVIYSVDGNTLTATAGDTTIFTFTLTDDSSGEAVFELLGQLDHADLPFGNQDNATLLIGNLGEFVQVEDTDGDIVDLDGKISIFVEDDPTVEEGTTTSVVTGVLAGVDTTETSEVELLLEEGAVVESDQGVLTSNGEDLVWEDNGDGTWSAVSADSDAVAFTVSTDATTGTYTVDLTGEVDTTEDITFSQSETVEDGDTTTVILSSEEAGDDLTVFATLGSTTGEEESVESEAEALVAGNAATSGSETEEGASEEGSDLSLQFFEDLATDDSSEAEEEQATALSNLVGATLQLDNVADGDTITYTLWQDGELVSDEFSITGEEGSDTDDGSASITITEDMITGEDGIFDEIQLSSGDGEDSVEVNFDDLSLSFSEEQTLDIEYATTEETGSEETDEATFSVSFDADGVESTASDEVENSDGTVAEADDTSVLGGNDESLVTETGDNDSTANSADTTDTDAGADANSTEDLAESDTGDAVTDSDTETMTSTTDTENGDSEASESADNANGESGEEDTATASTDSGEGEADESQADSSATTDADADPDLGASAGEDNAENGTETDDLLAGGDDSTDGDDVQTETDDGGDLAFDGMDSSDPDLDTLVDSGTV